MDILGALGKLLGNTEHAAGKAVGGLAHDIGNSALGRLVNSVNPLAPPTTHVTGAVAPQALQNLLGLSTFAPAPYMPPATQQDWPNASQGAGSHHFWDNHRITGPQGQVFPQSLESDPARGYFFEQQGLPDYTPNLSAARVLPSRAVPVDSAIPSRGPWAGQGVTIPTYYAPGNVNRGQI